MDRLEAMSILLRVADKGSFSAASRDLNMPLANVSRKVSDLETHLGTRLLLRTTRKLALTDAGARYLVSARRILEEVGEAEKTATGEFMAPRGELILTAPVLFGRLHVLPVVTDFLKVYPEINARLMFSDRNVQLIDEHIDVAVRIGPLPDSALVASRIGSIRTVICASPKLLKNRGRPAAPQDLSTLPCVNLEAFSTRSTWRFRTKDGGGTTEVDIKPRLSVSTAEAAVWAASQGVGVTQVLHYQCAEAVCDGTLEIILENAEPEPVPVHLITLGRIGIPLKTRSFLDFAAARLRQSLLAINDARRPLPLEN